MTRVAIATMGIAVLVADSAHTATTTQRSLQTSYGWICGCLDVEGNFYPGPSGGAYCWNTYQGEPWCIPE